jgi:hypothetical protein
MVLRILFLGFLMFAAAVLVMFLVSVAAHMH